MRFILLPIVLFAGMANAQDNVPPAPTAVPPAPAMQEAVPAAPPEVPANPATTPMTSPTTTPMTTPMTTRVMPDSVRVTPKPNNWRGTDIDWQAHVRSCQAHSGYNPATDQYREPSGVMRTCPR